MTAIIRARISQKIEDAQRAASDKSPTRRRDAALRRDTLRMVQNALSIAERHSGVEPCDEQALEVLFREASALDALAAALRRDNQEVIAQREEAEAAVLRELLPPPMSEPEIAAAIDAAITVSGATSARDCRKAMADMAPLLRGRADLKAAHEALAARLTVAAKPVKALGAIFDRTQALP